MRDLEDLAHSSDVALLLRLGEIAGILLGQGLSPEVLSCVLVLIAVSICIPTCLLQFFIASLLFIEFLLAGNGLHFTGHTDAFNDDLATTDVPLLLAHRRIKLLIVRDHQHRASPLIKRRRQRTEGFAIQVVGGLIQNEQMGTVPHGSGQNKLHLLSTGQSADLAVGSEFLLEAKVIQVLLNLGRGTGAKVQSSLLGRNFLVGLLQELLEAHGKQFLLGVVLVILLAHMSLLHLIFQNPSTDATRPDTLQAKFINRLQFFVGNAKSCRLNLLPIVCILETPLDVGCGRFLEMLLNMKE
mmetsp:Transcript_2571/g.7552  ORF Transcript_2571/g.7552 Transcript_2571/m.7552 type:complete len:298 (-) Transcript_2571:1381-2274(-)